MLDKIKSLFNSDDNSKDLAKERLRLILVHDRIGVSPEIIGEMKEEIIEVIAKHLEIEEQELEMDLSREDNSMALVANIPIKRLNKNKKTDQD